MATNSQIAILPTDFVRIGGKGFDSKLPRRFRGYRAAGPTELNIGGAQPKLGLVNQDDPADFFIAKLAGKEGSKETYTELFINRLGEELGLPMAHSGLARLDGQVYFLSHSFLQTDEKLVHGSLLIEEVFKAEGETDRIHRKQEQQFWSLDFIHDAMSQVCGDDFGTIFQCFIDMLMFDALIGSMDRHAQNWGIVATIKEPQSFRLAPIFDSARALLWNLEEDRIEVLESDAQAFHAYILRAKPIVGPVKGHPKVNHCNHFDLAENLLVKYPHQTKAALTRLPLDAGCRSAKILRQGPFQTAFSPLRKRVLTKIIDVRSNILKGILEKGG